MAVIPASASGFVASNSGSTLKIANNELLAAAGKTCNVTDGRFHTLNEIIAAIMRGIGTHPAALFNSGGSGTCRGRHDGRCYAVERPPVSHHPGND